MKKENAVYVIGPPIKVNGKKKVSRIKEAMAKLNIPFDYFELGWEFNIPVPESEGILQFRLLTDFSDNALYLPADFAERLEEMLYTPEPIT